MVSEEDLLEVRLFRPEQIARAAQVSTKTVYRLARLGLIPCRRIGRAVRFTPAQVEQILLGSDNDSNETEEGRK